MPHGTTLIQPTHARSGTPTLFRLNAAAFVPRLHEGGSGVSYPAFPPPACTMRRLSEGQEKRLCSIIAFLKPCAICLLF